jgi:hypothetical protein
LLTTVTCLLLKTRSTFTTRTDDHVVLCSSSCVHLFSGMLQARALISALHTSGDVLLHGNKLYLKPEEVADMILMALPDTEEEAQV